MAIYAGNLVSKCFCMSVKFSLYLISRVDVINDTRVLEVNLLMQNCIHPF